MTTKKQTPKKSTAKKGFRIELKLTKILLLAFVIIITGCEGKNAIDIISDIFSLVPKVARGYDQVKFGSSTEKVKKTYNITGGIYREENDSAEGVTRLKQENISDSITERTFLFHNNKLYRVWVTYSNNIDKNILSSTLTNTLKEKYGDYNETLWKSEQTITEIQRVPRTTSIPMPVKRIGAVSGLYVTDRYVMQSQTYYEDVPITTTKTVYNYSRFFNKYSPNIEVELQYGETFNTIVCYTWKKERDKFKPKEKTKVEL